MWLAVSALLVVLAPAPMVDLPLGGRLTNRGTLGGEAVWDPAPTGQEGLFDQSPWGECVDLTAAARHGGTTAEPAGTALRLRTVAPRAWDTFTIVLWARLGPGSHGLNARLAMTERGWDLMPIAGGVVLGLGTGAEKVMHPLTIAPAQRRQLPADGDWQFYAAVVERERLCGWLGGLRAPLLELRPAPRQGPHPEAWGELVLGNLMGIRPYRGWLARFRVYPEALSADEVAALWQADVNAARQGAGAPVPLPLRPDPPARRCAFRRSAITFSTRWQKPEGLATASAFGSTDLLWVYGAKPDYIAAAKAAGLRYQGTLNGLQGSERCRPGLPNDGDETGRHEDLDGNRNLPSWMVTFKPTPYTGCVNSPAFRKLFFDAARKLVEAGVDAIQVDDGAMNGSWVRHAGVCFCPNCRTGFRQWLQQRHSAAELAAFDIAAIGAFDYRDHLRAHGVPDAATYRKRFAALPLTPEFVAYQIASTRQFYRDLRRLLDEWSPARPLAISVNENLLAAGSEGQFFHADLVDFFLGEVYRRGFAENLTLNKAAEAFGLTMVSSPIPTGRADCTRTVALAYALGQQHLVPWDIYMGSDATGIQPRYFGAREEYGPLFDFVSRQPELFDAMQPASEVAVLYNADREPSRVVERACLALARQQVQFRLLVSAAEQARVPLRAADLAGVRLLWCLSAPESLPAEDRQVLAQALDGRHIHVLPADADVTAAVAARGADMLGLEAPAGVFAFVRGADDGTAIVHLVNQNCRADADEAESYRNVTVDLNRPSRWEPLTEVTWHEPGAEPVRVEPERHGTVIRVTVPRLGAWGMLRLRRGTTLAVAGSSGSPIGSDAARDADHRTDAIGE